MSEGIGNEYNRYTYLGGGRRELTRTRPMDSHYDQTVGWGCLPHLEDCEPDADAEPDQDMV